ncbi:response regulator transcription factor [Alkalihalobacillus sp. AL-G]|uniref:response regulator transcription factor n=1 Tax=Alkalihalobacillus sp. AL-G TaxID=2926399 RepID=UPI00272C10D8|nr:response regulator transcription factor [Alkalihalobacillus sp. AL-G]WLD92510.1 response regulator transcription factor [Alkalihalobacillus sp. AL-G]
METIKLFLVDDHDMVRRGLSSYLITEPAFEIIGEASSGNDAVQRVRELKPDVILMDLIMEDGNGIEATREIIKFHPNCKIIILTSFYDDEQVFPAIEAGAFSYVLKTASAEEITSTIKKAYTGESVIESKVAQKMMNRFRGSQRLPHDDLTPREREVLILIGEGKTNQEIGDTLFIGIKTVKTHVSNILSKLNVTDRTQAAIYANRNNLT